ncbi:MAG: dihydrolipoyllysine-residue acetyltransferase [Gammaproteobacteria bacterium]|nr:MAG: dihydrolipoyllysine-residue acetyltransferase [Gammaproteobacteria bacterium]
MSKETIKIPDLGGADEVEVIEVCVKAGDAVSAEQSLVVLESDKASMEIPCPVAGTVVSIALKVGDKVKQGQDLLVLETAAAGTKPEAPKAAAPKTEPAAQPAPAAAKAAPASVAAQTIPVPDLGGADSVSVIELCVKAGDTVAEGDSLVVLESDKASMEIPSPVAGKVVSLAVKVGDTVSQGAALAVIESTAAVPASAAKPETAPAPAAAPAPAQAASPAKKENPLAATVGEPKSFPTLNGRSSEEVYAGPATRMLARELGVDLAQVSGSGPRGRIQKDDLHNWVKQRLQQAPAGVAAGGGSGIPAIPAVDFSRFGAIDQQDMSRLHKITAQNMQRSWLNVPHVTQFDDADITDLEDFRDSLRDEAKKRGVKMTPMPFILKACAVALKNNPKFNASLHADGDHVVYKQYVHIGIAVDTPAGLMVPVIKDVDKKSLWELAAEIVVMADKAKERKLKPEEMQGGCFTVSSLGSIGGLGFTPIVNAPEVGILGVSRLSVKPMWDGQQFVPRKMLPLSLSYDHRAVNGADAGRFLTELTALLADLRRLAL